MHKVTVNVALKALTLGVLGGCLWFYASSGLSQASPTRVIIAEQPGSPLFILSTFVDSSNRLQPRYGYSLTNSADKAIVAYTIVESVSLGPGSRLVGSTFTHSPAKKLFLEPHSSKQEEGGDGKAYQQAPVEIVLAVDFVEFADGTRWGDDTTKSGELLDGKRAGGKAAMRKYRAIFASEGLAGLDEALTNADLIIPESSKSDHWLNGFKMGVNLVKSRLKTQKAKGRDGIRGELNKPFDSTEGRQEP